MRCKIVCQNAIWYEIVRLAMSENCYTIMRMSFRDLQDPAIRALPGYSPLLDKPRDFDELVTHGTLYQRLLQSFWSDT